MSAWKQDRNEEGDSKAKRARKLLGETSENRVICQLLTERYSSYEKWLSVTTICLTVASSSVSFGGASSFVDYSVTDDDTDEFGVGVGSLAVLATLLAAISKALKFQAKKESFSAAAKRYEMVEAKLRYCINADDINARPDSFWQDMENELMDTKGSLDFFPTLKQIIRWKYRGWLSVGYEDREPLPDDISPATKTALNNLGVHCTSDLIFLGNPDEIAKGVEVKKIALLQAQEASKSALHYDQEVEKRANETLDRIHERQKSCCQKVKEFCSFCCRPKIDPNADTAQSKVEPTEAQKDEQRQKDKEKQEKQIQEIELQNKEKQRQEIRTKEKEDKERHENKEKQAKESEKDKAGRSEKAVQQDRDRAQKLFREASQLRVMYQILSLRYGKYADIFQLIGIALTTSTAIISFVHASSLVTKEAESDRYSILAGTLTALAAALASISKAWHFEDKRGSYATAAKMYEVAEAKLSFMLMQCKVEPISAAVWKDIESEMIHVKGTVQFVPPVKDVWRLRRDGKLDIGLTAHSRDALPENLSPSIKKAFEKAGILWESDLVFLNKDEVKDLKITDEEPHLKLTAVEQLKVKNMIQMALNKNPKLKVIP